MALAAAIMMGSLYVLCGAGINFRPLFSTLICCLLRDWVERFIMLLCMVVEGVCMCVAGAAPPP